MEFSRPRAGARDDGRGSPLTNDRHVVARAARAGTAMSAVIAAVNRRIRPTPELRAGAGAIHDRTLHDRCRDVRMNGRDSHHVHRA